jgi:hypothetical protein
LDRTEADILRGERARQLLEEPLLVEAFALIEREYQQAWQDSPARDVQARELLYLSLKNLAKVKGHLTQVMESGQIAKATLAQRAGRTLKAAFSR